MKTPVPAIFGELLAKAMNEAVANGANSVSMPDEYVEAAAWLAEVERTDRVPDPSVGTLVIEIEKFLCSLLGREWSPSGMSIESLARGLTAKRCEQCAELLSTLKELADLVDAIRDGEYTPDSFTTQPARSAIAKVQAGGDRCCAGGPR